jgi:endonuclease/exonuclease/phosphatase family metal-dependent hydrolase
MAALDRGLDRWFRNFASLSVGSWNIHGISVFAGGIPPARYGRMGKNLRGSDVVVLQEAFEDKEVKRLIKAAGYPHVVKGPDPMPRVPPHHSGLYILSRHPIAETRSLVYEDAADFDIFATKGVVAARITPDDMPPVWIATTHMQAQTEEDETRESQARQLTDFLERELGHPDQPVILVGDVNMKPKHQSYHLFRKISGFADVNEFCLEQRFPARFKLDLGLDVNTIFKNTNDRHFVHPRFLRAEPGSAECCIEPARGERRQHFIDKDGEEPASDHPTYDVTYQIAW